MTPPPHPTLSREGRGNTYATIDIGTNAVLLLVANTLCKGEVTSPLQVLRDEARITRLGEGLHQNPQFLQQAIERTFSVFKEYKEIADSLSAQEILAVGTAGFRKATNAQGLIESVKRELGFKIQIISGEEEARLSYLSAATDFPQYPNLFVLDIGGGSTEIISKEGGISLDLGAVVLTERIIKNDPPTEMESKRMEQEIDQIVGSRCPRPGRGNPAPTLVGLAGSVTTLSAIKQKLKTWDGSKVQGSVLTLSDLGNMIPLFRKTTNKERSAIPGMVKGREDTILAGTLILKKVMEKIGVSEVIVSDRGLRYGLIYDRLRT